MLKTLALRLVSLRARSAEAPGDLRSLNDRVKACATTSRTRRRAWPAPVPVTPSVTRRPDRLE